MLLLDSGICTACIAEAPRPETSEDLDARAVRVCGRYPERLLRTVGFAMGLIDSLGILGGATDGDDLWSGDMGVVLKQICFKLSESLLLLVDVVPWHLTGTERLLLQDALIARNAAIEGEHATVDAFSRTWLGLEQPGRWRTAVEMALLGDWVDALQDGAADDLALRALLRQEADVAHRQLLPLWERRTRGRRVTLLSQPVAEDRTLADVVPDRCSPEALLLDDEFQDQRVAAVLGQLAAPEEAVARTWASGANSWEEAALETTLPAVYGERVRTKLKRLGRRHSARAATADAWVRSRA
ncbi:hypothetical protein ACFW81_16045 [Streptomyces angustmyceticus]|uniref:hypothetical protein n=1 Tax=Streptomyces angustmyceticus TaxID=285578 RepID=UPI00369B3E41